MPALFVFELWSCPGGAGCHKCHISTVCLFSYLPRAQCGRVWFGSSLLHNGWRILYIHHSLLPFLSPLHHQGRALRSSNTFLIPSSPLDCDGVREGGDIETGTIVVKESQGAW